MSSFRCPRPLQSSRVIYRTGVCVCVSAVRSHDYLLRIEWSDSKYDVVRQRFRDLFGPNHFLSKTVYPTGDLGTRPSGANQVNVQAGWGNTTNPNAWLYCPNNQAGKPAISFCNPGLYW